MRYAIIGLVFLTVVLLGAAASARPPQTSKSHAEGDAPEVGRARMRDRIVPLSRTSLAEGGAASELKEAFASDVMADIDHEHRKRSSARE